MALSPDEFYERALAAADDERRLPLSRMTGWEISPFEESGLTVSPLRPRGAHLHVWFFARPEGQGQLYGGSRTP